MKPGLRVAVDIGGTFTDIVVQDRAQGRTSLHKVPSTPADPSHGMLRGLDELGIIGNVGFLVHGTTAGLNALLSRTGERIALVTTAGFEDVALLGRGGNRDIWNLDPVRVDPLVDRSDVFGIAERTRHDGVVESAPPTADVAALAAELRAGGITSVAVSFLHAHQNPANELALREQLAELLPEASVVLSHQVAPEQGEFERTSTTLATSYVVRTVERYLATLERELAARQCAAPLQVMRSSGGICSAELVNHQPIQTILSGPAGGVVAVETLAWALDRPNLIAIDMGGTSSDVSLVVDGRMTLATESEIGEQIMRMPVVELHTIGAGGGSLARSEAGGLRVGPKSAGSEPGPACYGRGGTEPTVTDAQALLGRINPDWFLGGRMALDLEAARRAMQRLGDELGMDPIAVAEGIVAVATSMMANAIRTLTMRRGIDVRDFSLVAFGGAGPLHGAALAEELGLGEVVVPFATGVLSAWGMLHADVRHDVSAPFTGIAGERAAPERLESVAAELRSRGEALLDAEGVPVADRSFELSADMRYVGQEHTITVALSETARALTLFHAAYRRQYGHAMPAAPVEYVNLRLAAIGAVAAPPGDAAESGEAAIAESSRSVRIDGADHEARFIHRSALRNAPIDGPAVILEAGSTTLVPPGWRAESGQLNTMLLRKVRA